MFITKFYRAIKIIFENFYDKFSYCVCELSIGDIMLKRGNIDLCQFTTCTRLLDVKHYFLTGKPDFPYQNIVSRKRWGNKHCEEEGNISFKRLIESYNSTGFRINSLFEVYKNFRLLNGTHRSACNLFFNFI